MTHKGGGSKGGVRLKGEEELGGGRERRGKKEGRKTLAGTVLRLFSVVLGILPGQH